MPRRFSEKKSSLPFIGFKIWNNPAKDDLNKGKLSGWLKNIY